MQLTKKVQLFIISGASGIGKSTLCEYLLENEREYIVMESDLLWHPRLDTPEDNYQEFRRLWMRMAAQISQVGMPVVLCGCAVPEQFEAQMERDLFTEIHYLALVARADVLTERMRVGRGIHDEAWIASSVSFNNWLKENGENTVPAMTLQDISSSSVDEAAKLTDQWILKRIH